MRPLLFTRLQFCLFVLLGLMLGHFWFAQPVLANPYFFITGTSSVTTGTNYEYLIKMHTDGNTVTAAQATLQIPSSYFSIVSFSISGSNCSLWTPANSAPPGENTTKTTPYAYNNNAVFTCGFSNPGINSADALIGKITLSPILAGSTNLSFATTSGYNKFYYIGTEITPGAMSDYTVSITGAGQPTATPTPTVTPTPGGPSNTPTPTATPTPTPTGSSGGGTTPTPTSSSGSSSSSSSGGYALSSGDVTFVTLAPMPTTGSGVNDVPLEQEVVEDNTVPSPPEMTPRPTPSPIPTAAPPSEDSGEVLAVQSIRELLIPGKSEADRTVVMINFISVLSLLSLMAIITWRLLTSNRAQKVKAAHLKEMVSGELAALESKLNVLQEKNGKEEFQNEFTQTMESLMNEIQNGGNTKKGG